MDKAAQPNNIEDFIAGLKQIIRNSWPTQEEFAKGVTSKVNMSNILRGTGGTSYKMREALANRAGMTVEDVVALGQKRKEGTSQYSPIGGEELIPVPARRATDIKAPSEEDETGYGIAALMNKAAELTASMHTANDTHAKAMTTLLHNVTRERDKLLTLLAQEQATLNGLPIAVKVLDRDMKVVYANRAMMERFGIMMGDKCAEESLCELCGEVTHGIAEQVFKHGQPVRKVFLHSDGVQYVISAYPVTDSAWTVSRVTMLVYLAEPLFDLFKGMGWTPPKTKAKTGAEG